MFHHLGRHLLTKTSFWGVFWVDVSTETLAESGFLDIAGRLQVPVKTLEEARQALANVKERWLLILDNADDPKVDYQRYFPTGSRGVVMLTSRNDEYCQYATEQVFALDGLSHDEARELLLRAAGVPRNQRLRVEGDAQAVVSLLSSHPLALIQAGSYVGRDHCTLAGYLGVFAQQRKRLLAFRPTQARSRYGDVYATFEASAEILQASTETTPPSPITESARDALELLPVLASCGPSRLPLPVFEAGWKGAQEIVQDTADDDDDALRLTQWHVSRLPSFTQAGANAWDSFRLIEAVHLCKAFALVSTDSHDGFVSVSMHPLVHAWARDRADAREQHEAWVATGCLMAVSRSDGELWRQRGRQLQSHLQALTLWDSSRMFSSEPSMKVASILTNCGRLLYDIRDDARVFMLMNNLLAHLGLDRQNVEERWLAVYKLIARNLVNYGKVKEAVSLLEQVVKIEEQTLAEDHPSRLTSQHELAGAYRANGQVKEAVSLLEQVVKIKEQTLAEDHPDQLASQHELAGAYQANGQVKKAVSLLEQVVKIKEQTLAEDHPDRLVSQHTLAGAYGANGQVKKAVSLLEQVVKIQEQTLAEDHPSRLASQYTLATVYWDLNRHNIAVQMMKHVVRIRSQVLDEQHPDRKNSEAWLEYFKDELREPEPT
jgi:tetratricopeptide (TPR) repeat protein